MFWTCRPWPWDRPRVVYSCVVAVALAAPWWLCETALAAATTSESGSSFKDIASGVGAAVGVVIALLGTPSMYLSIKKTQAEIRKLELEALRLQAEQGDTAPASASREGGTYNIRVDGSRNVVSITADLRLLGPLLVLLDFVVATIILTVAGYLLNFGGLSLFSPLLALVALVLFIPIFREARRLKRVLTPSTGAQEAAAPGSAH
jgi:hypothetical protein